ncbi:MAG: thioredoxin family protein [Oscillospiraceae bacterium]|nr:thioredoxin family protein [Oscillospiraceae bacterium]
MREILYFHFESCPYCQQANRWLEDLLAENPRYQAIPITRVDERKDPVLADQYDYYYVPTFYVGGRKVHEGAASREKVEAVLEQALAAEGASAG